MLNKLLSIIFALGILIWNPYPLQIAELKTFDWLIMNTEPVQNNNILIVDLDENFIQEYGGWPLPRTAYADLITTTSAIPGITVLMPNVAFKDGTPITDPESTYLELNTLIWPENDNLKTISPRSLPPFKK